MSSRSASALARAMLAPDPVAAIRDASADPRLPKQLRTALREADADGIRIAALAVARTRFERLVRGDPDAAAWFGRDPAGFTEAFVAYHRAVRPTALFPSGEAALFRRWQLRRP